MYKIFLVEDEIVVRESIRDNIAWNKTEFIFAGEAPDGEIALPLIKETEPDILITDIRMPFMDGLELSRFIKKNMPWIKIIIISGHQEFEYAKKAISIGIEEYVLKPVSSKDLLEVLNKVARHIENEKKQIENVQIMNKYMNDNLELMKEKFLNDLLMGTVPPHIVAERISTFGIDIFAKYYAVIRTVVEINQDGDYNQYLYIEDTMNKIAKEKVNIIKFKRSLNETIIILKGDERSLLESNCQIISEEIINKTAEILLFKISVDIGSVQERIQGISKSFKGIKDSTHSDPVLNKYEDILQQELCKMNENQKEYSEFNDNQILNALHYESKAGIQQVIDNYFDKIKDLKISAVWSIYLAIRINLVVSNFLSELGVNAKNILPKQNRIEEMAIKFDTPDKLKKYIEDVVRIAFDYREERKNSLHFETIANAKLYIEENYSNPNISLNMIASYVNMSPCHFSTVFSQGSGQTFIQCLTNARMKKAKGFLNTTNMKSGEIGLLVGYKDPHYFSYIFKKNVGCKPRDYGS